MSGMTRSPSSTALQLCPTPSPPRTPLRAACDNRWDRTSTLSTLSGQYHPFLVFTDALHLSWLNTAPVSCHWLNSMSSCGTDQLCLPILLRLYSCRSIDRWIKPQILTWTDLLQGDDKASCNQKLWCDHSATEVHGRCGRGAEEGAEDKEWHSPGCCQSQRRHGSATEETSKLNGEQRGNNVHQ